MRKRTKVILGSRGSGVSSNLVFESHMTNVPILTSNERMREVYLKKAESHGITIPNPICLNEIHSRGGKLGDVIIDDFNFAIEKFIEDLYECDVKVIAMGVTIE